MRLRLLGALLSLATSGDASRPTVPAAQHAQGGPALPSPRPRLGTREPIPRTASVRAVRGLYDAFNARDAERAGSFLTDDCVYEDLLLGPATVCRGKESFIGALSMHPAFISDRFVAGLPAKWRPGLPGLELVVDSIADGVGAVGVEWHVELGGQAIPLGRGLTHAIICKRSGKISRVVDIAEAPWRTVGIALAPAVQLARNVASVAGAMRADRQSVALAFASIWCLLSTLAVSRWVFSDSSPFPLPPSPPRLSRALAEPAVGGARDADWERADARALAADVWREAKDD
ncbi:hypothetical protein KFE25_011894 [Diacronema lutheri]|uniref:SnoaL-like domain-containing protein n=2 Tax=Diacronema lutheri TaxID=2081491 RepID=A0A8J6CAE6_DIALT|nr:hypothetical protein KFE25_011894 [Diacronema lutheri]